MKSVRKTIEEMLGKMDERSGFRQHLVSAIKRSKTEFHKDHGRGSLEDGPDDPDCPCRETELEKDCAEQGCGFCIASQTSNARLANTG